MTACSFPASTGDPPALQAQGLGVDLVQHGRTHPLLAGIDLTLRRRAVLGVIGESGAGKSVLARALCNWIEPPLVARGQVRLAGREILGLPASAMAGLWGKRIAYIGADPTTTFDPTLGLGRQIVEKLRAVDDRVSRREAEERVIALLAEVRIPQARARFDDLPHQFSGGMIQRAAIVDALITDPEVLIADSITQPLDVTVAAQIVRLLHDLRVHLHTAIVFISPSLAVVREMAEDVLVLAGGRVVEQRPLEALLDAPVHAYSKRLLAQIPRIWGDDDVPAGDPAAEVLLAVHEVHKAYSQHRRGALLARQTVQAVRGVSFEVRRGERFGIVGESGCGKSTLSRLLTALEAPDAGRITFAGDDLAAMGRRELHRLRSRFQLVLPDPYGAIPAHWPIGRIVGEPLRIHPGAAAHETQRVLAVMREVGLPAEWLQRLPGDLSAGQRQRINLARALVLEPELLILDETLSALDPSEQRQLLDLLARLQRSHGLTTIFISHDLAMVRRICDRIAVMYLGRIVELGANRPTFFEPLHPYTRALLAALPTLEIPRFSRERCLLDGESPSPIDLPPGCSFASRCPLAYHRCAAEDPAFRPLGQRGAACHLAEDGGADRAASEVR